MGRSTKLSNLLPSGMADVFSGDYAHKDAGINEMREEILDISSIAGIHADKETLREDLNTFLKDTL